jgi:hypothetical protein
LIDLEIQQRGPMEREEIAENRTDAEANRRQIPRFDVDEPAAMLLVAHDARRLCRILDLSLGGCRLHSDEKLIVGVSMRVEVSFKVNGIVLRFPGVVQWTDGRHMAGVRVAEMSRRRRDELTEILAEVKDENAARAAKEAAAAAAAEEQATADKVADDLLWEQVAQRTRVEQNGRQRLSDLEDIRALAEQEIQQKLKEHAGLRKKKERESLQLGAQFRSAAATPLPVNPVPASAPVAPASDGPPKERRTQTRHEVDTAAVIYLIKINSRQPGRIVDLSLGGCQIKTDAKFPVGIYTRVETEFYLEGLPFRLGGVVQVIHNGNRVGIRFLDMSPRKKYQLEQLMVEIQEAGAIQEADREEGTGKKE